MVFFVCFFALSLPVSGAMRGGGEGEGVVGGGMVRGGDMADRLGRIESHGADYEFAGVFVHGGWGLVCRGQGD